MPTHIPSQGGGRHLHRSIRANLFHKLSRPRSFCLRCSTNAGTVAGAALWLIGGDEELEFDEGESF